MQKVLLTTVCRPLGPKHGDAPSVGYELLYGQVTRAQGIFSPRATHVAFGLDYIAHNLETPATVLHYPSERQLLRELKRGYDYIGISFILGTYHKMKKVSALVRKHSPATKIILGGYGTVLSDSELKPWGDHFCRGEGVAYMRELLGEPPRPMPFDHPTIVSKLRFFSLPASQTGMIFGGLGCPNGCDFCSTSHFFSRKHIPLLPTGADLYRVVRQYLEKDPSMQFTVLDEDFLLNKQRAMEFRERVIAGGVPLSIFAFASVKALSQYTTDELLEMGVDGVWVGYEGTRSNYEKQKGRPVEELIPELTRKGFTVLSSMIVGFDYQDRETVARELRGLMRLRPAYSQFLIYGPTPGTPFYKRIVEEKRLRPEMAADPEEYYRRCTGFTSMVTHPKLSAREIEDLQQWCYEQDFERLGPSVFRSVRTWLNGYLSQRVSASALLRAKAERNRAAVRFVYPIFLAGKLLGPNRRMRRWVAALERRCYEECGAPTLADRVRSVGALAMACWTALTLRIDWFQHPHLAPKRFRWTSRLEELMRFYGELRKDGAAAELRVRFERRTAELRVRLEGALDGKNAEAFGRRFDEALSRGREALVVNMEGLKFIDRKGAAAFTRAFRRYRRRVRVIPPAQLLQEHPDLRALFARFRPATESA
ncbi:MAG: STAS domain-containing protein [Elusimicrobiota bacterium]|jgi:haloalkane dehalogenase